MRRRENMAGRGADTGARIAGSKGWRSWLAVLALSTAAALLQVRVDRVMPEAESVSEILYIPSGTFLKQAALGYEQAWADILWLRTIGYYADQATHAGKFTYLYHMLDIITSLDPMWLYPYLFGGVTLSLDLGRPDLGNKLLEKAIPEHPTVWKIPFLIGYNAYFGMGDARTAGRYIEKASRLPDAPAYLARLSSRMYSKGGDRENALKILEEVIHQTEDPQLRKRLIKRYREILSGRIVGPHENRTMREGS